jgi:hypothetical protein
MERLVSFGSGRKGTSELRWTEGPFNAPFCSVFLNAETREMEIPFYPERTPKRYLESAVNCKPMSHKVTYTVQGVSQEGGEAPLLQQ